MGTADRSLSTCNAITFNSWHSMRSMRPDVTERLGLGPEVCLARNRQLVYGRMTECDL